jgi:nucleotide-binding universal stress UspA family protein
MHVVVATDGSQASLAGARQFRAFADPSVVTDVTVVAVVSPYAAAPFANEIGPVRTPAMAGLSFVDDARLAADTVATEFDGWGPRVQSQIRSGSPAQEIIRTAEELDAALIVLAAGSRGLSRTILLGSTASRVQHSAPCSVLICRSLAQGELPRS